MTQITFYISLETCQLSYAFFFVPYHGSYLLLFLRKVMFLPMHSYAWDDIFLRTVHGYPLWSSILMYSLIVKILTLISPSISLEVMTLSLSPLCLCSSCHAFPLYSHYAFLILHLSFSAEIPFIIERGSCLSSCMN